MDIILASKSGRLRSIDEGFSSWMADRLNDEPMELMIVISNVTTLPLIEASQADDITSHRLGGIAFSMVDGIFYCLHRG